MNAKPIIEVHDLCVAYNNGSPDETVVLRHLSLTVNEGETVMVTGANGSGKTTLLNAIAGTVPIRSGTIRVKGIDVTSWPRYRRARLLGLIHQDPMLSTCPNMSLYENLQLTGGNRWWLPFPSRLALDHQKPELLTSSGLPFQDKAATLLKSLSGGQRQGAAIVLALTSNRSVLLMDEFTSSLDEESRKLYLSTITKESARRKLTILGVTHAPETAQILQARILRMVDGRLGN
jgi:putative ABC transport system ATP-binding protein